MDYDIGAAIPHRPPFLLIDGILELTSDSVRASATLRPDDELWSRIYAGHYPGNPVTPGVLLCEMMFQAAAVLASAAPGGEAAGGMPVVTRIQSAKFRAMVFPGDTLEIRVSLVERLANAFFMKGSVLKNGRAAVQADFAVAAVADPDRER